MIAFYNNVALFVFGNLLNLGLKLITKICNSQTECRPKHYLTN